IFAARASFANGRTSDMHSRLFSAIVLLAATIALRGSPAHAGCNLIPGATKTFAGTLGATNRPFSAPGEPVEINVRGCDASPGLAATGPEHVVSVVIKPAAGGAGKL